MPVNPNNEGTVAWYRFELEQMGIEIPSGALKQDLIDLYEGA